MIVPAFSIPCAYRAELREARDGPGISNDDMVTPIVCSLIAVYINNVAIFRTDK